MGKKQNVVGIGSSPVELNVVPILQHLELGNNYFR